MIAQQSESTQSTETSSIPIEQFRNLLDAACVDGSRTRYEEIHQRNGLTLWCIELIGPLYKLNYELPEREPVVTTGMTSGWGYDDGKQESAELYVDRNTGKIHKEKYINQSVWVRNESAKKVIEDFTYLHSHSCLKELDTFDRKEFDP